MNVNGRPEMLRLFMLADDDDFEVVLLLLLYWRHRTSHCTTWLTRKRLTLQRIVEERRIEMFAFFHDILPAYHNVQFEEHFRTARATFEVIVLLHSYMFTNY